MSLLTVSDLTKTYHHRKIVDNISLSISDGEIVGLLGPNGAGKTSCFYMILGIIHVDSGTIVLNNQNITHFPIHKRAHAGLGYLPQEASIFRKLSVSDNIMAILETQPHLSSSECETRLDELLTEFRLTGIRNSMGISLSGGERRRVEIARALATNPRFILLDEPFAGVDPRSIVDIKQIIQHLSQKKIGILITDHNVRDTLDICERAYIVNNGHVLTEGTTEHILSHAGVRDVYLGHEFKI